MNARKRHLSIASALICSSALISCGGLPRPLREDIAAEHERLRPAEERLKRTTDEVNAALKQKAALFNGTVVATQWPSRLHAAQDELDRAKKNDQELVKLSRASSKEEARHAEILLREERSLREGALRDSDAIASEEDKWMSFDRQPSVYLTRMQNEYDSLRNFDAEPVTKIVQKAEQDWPAKKDQLEARLAPLKQASTDATAQWDASASARAEAAGGHASGAAVATLMKADEALSTDAATLTNANQIPDQAGQLYNSWDKILEDLDKTREGSDAVYREKLKTVKTHYTDVAAKKTEVSSDVQWADVSPATYRSVEKDLGMTIAHKDAGQFDSEVTTIAQPPGFSYMATPEQGRNQYGYWSGGMWTWLPEYLIMRELFWGRNYQPIYINEYHGYQSAQRFGRTYYGNESPSAPPKYGSHGTFTEQRYSGSRYVQSGGFKGSSYSSSREADSPRNFPGTSRPREEVGGDSIAGKRFGGGNSPSAEGKRFGGGSSPSAGKRFGGGGSRMPSRSFGGRRR
jgi:hypothetical protein